MPKRTIDHAIPITIHEPKRAEDGSVTSIPVWLIIGGGTYTHDGKSYPFGVGGGTIVAYLPDSRAVTVEMIDVIHAGLAAIAPPPERNLFASADEMLALSAGALVVYEVEYFDDELGGWVECDRCWLDEEAAIREAKEHAASKVYSAAYYPSEDREIVFEVIDLAAAE